MIRFIAFLFLIGCFQPSDRQQSITNPGVPGATHRGDTSQSADSESLDTGDTTMGYSGIIVGVDGTDRRIRYENACVFEYNISVVCGGWMPEGTSTLPPVAVSSTGTPPYAQSSSNTVAWTGTRPMPDDYVNLTDDPAGYKTITEIEVWYLRGAAADSVTVTLYRALRDGSGAGASVVGYGDAEFATADGAWHKYTGVVNHAMDPDYFYFFRAGIDPNAAAADARLGPMFVRVSRNGPE